LNAPEIEDELNFDDAHDKPILSNNDEEEDMHEQAK